MYQLTFQNGQVFSVDGFCLIGRNPDVNVVEGAKLLVVDDSTKTVSKTHAALAVTGDGKLMIEDLESTNGTFVAGEEEFEKQVTNGDPVEIHENERVRLGDVYFDITKVINQKKV
ncbi:MAG: FHA domain-containing protein [Candidatus Ancillula trichonymphae]|jgi:pSer/pThr/pTyr-binding forkhead associated (FHA) protein|nr:FHA domain-containing protein [Candidatus Ancillula trichonymphae]